MVKFVPKVREPQFYDALPEFTMIDAHARMASMRHPRAGHGSERAVNGTAGLVDNPLATRLPPGYGSGD